MALPTEEWNAPGTHFLLKTCIELRKPFGLGVMVAGETWRGQREPYL